MEEVYGIAETTIARRRAFMSLPLRKVVEWSNDWILLANWEWQVDSQGKDSLVSRGRTEMIRCSCLVEVHDKKILLVRVRENLHWYLPGGKIEEGETPEQALSRELFEELGIEVLPISLAYLYTVVGPAYGISDEVELNCFSASWKGTLQPNKEITEVSWIGIHERERLAPAVNTLLDTYYRTPSAK